MTRVLLVDDDEGNRLTLGALLEDEKWEVVLAESSSDASAIIADAPPFDLVIVDQFLEDGLGSDLLPQVRDRGEHTRVVMISGDPDAHTVTGFSARLPKFGDVVRTLETLRAICAEIPR